MAGRTPSTSTYKVRLLRQVHVPSVQVFRRVPLVVTPPHIAPVPAVDENLPRSPAPSGARAVGTGLQTCPPRRNTSSHSLGARPPSTTLPRSPAPSRARA